MFIIRKNKLKYEIKELYRTVKREYIKACRTPEQTPEQRQLSEGYYLLEMLYKQIVNSLDGTLKLPTDKDGRPVIYNSIERLVCDGKLPDNETLAATLAKMKLSLEEAVFCELFIKTALFVTVCREYNRNHDRFSSGLFSIRKTDSIEYEKLFYRLCAAERILLTDSCYKVSDENTKAYFRQLLISESKKRKLSDVLAAKQLKAMAEKQGISLCGLLVRQSENILKGYLLLISEAVLPLLASVAAALISGKAVFAFLLYFPFWQLIKVLLLDRISSKIKKRTVPQIELGSEIPDGAKTVIVISSLLESCEKAETVKKHLLKVYLANRDKNIKLCLLADLPESKEPISVDDRPKTEALKQIISELNSDHPDSFAALVRNRTFVKTQSAFACFERKRGAIEQFVRFIKTGVLDDNYLLACGALESMKNAKYIFALDSDSVPEFGCVRELLSAALHPLNAPVIDKRGNYVREGYGIIMPKLRTDTFSAYSTLFTRIRAGTGGMSVYDAKAGERYFDLFSYGVFTGKGLIDADAYYTVLNGRFKKERVLSHDILEGELLRTAYLESAEICDGFPSSERAFLLRLHRWIRGDVQNFAFLKKRAPFDGKYRNNPFGFVTRFKLFDNLRRALLSVNTGVLILSAVLFDKETAAFLIILSVLLLVSDELSALLSFFRRSGFKRLKERYFSDAVPDFLLLLAGGVMNITQLPRIDVNNLDAVLRGFIRLISGQKLLEWVTAQQGESGGKKRLITKFDISSILFAAVSLLNDVTAGKLLSPVFLLGIILARYTEKRIDAQRHTPDTKERERLMGYAYAMWSYFKENCDRENNYLPPDNIQFSPEGKTAHRTSPTNIGMMLVSVLCARDFGFINDAQLYGYLKRTLDTLKKLQKYRGNLFNWYDTETLEPLPEIYVSAVDSGNLLCCLTALKQGVAEYLPREERLSEIISEISRLIEQTDLSFLYNERKHLFHIGFSVSRNELTDSYYDLMMSEARMTSYYAVAKGFADRRHWQSLSRATTSCNGFSGPVSWGGSVFEYFMPNLFLPAVKNTLCYEALRYCVYAQKLRVRHKSLPFGISESGFYMLDGSSNYAYKSHGVAKLSLQHRPNDETVISPYSTFLILPFSPVSALKNLRALEALGCTGKYGFFEAVDFSRQRCGQGKYGIVRSFMSHHLGMSIVSVNNYLNDNIMQKRFMSDEDMLSADSLLYEQINRDSTALKLKEKSTRPERERYSRFPSAFNEIQPSDRCTQVYADGEYSLVLCCDGCGFGRYNSRNVSTHSTDSLFAPMGIFAFLKNRGEIIPFQRAPLYIEGLRYSYRFKKSFARLNCENENVQLSQRVSSDGNLPCERRRYSVNVIHHAERETELYIYFEPSMVREGQEIFHRAFSKLFIQGEKDEKRNIVIFSRKSRNADEAPFYLACGFTDSADFECCLSRERALARKGGIKTLFQKPFESQNIGMLDCCAFIKRKLKLTGGRGTAEFFTVCAQSISQLTARVDGIRNKVSPSSDAVRGVAENISEQKILSDIFFGKGKNLNNPQCCNRGVLWSKGISGDNPIITCSFTGEDGDLPGLLRLHYRLRLSGINTDLIIFADGKTKSQAAAFCKRHCPEDAMGVNGGIFVIDQAELSNEELLYFRDRACFNADGEPEPAEAVSLKEIFVNEPTRESRMTENGFIIEKKPNLPWCYCIGNRSFGTLLSDKSLGFTFAVNSYLNKLTAWKNDTRTDNTECIYVFSGDRIYDVTASSAVSFSQQHAVYTAEIDGLFISTRVSVAQKGMKKTAEVMIKNTAKAEKSLKLFYYCEPWLCENGINAQRLCVETGENAVFLKNCENRDFCGTMFLSLDGGPAIISTDKKSFFSAGIVPSDGVFNGCAAVGRELNIESGKEEKLTFNLGFAMNRDAAVKLCEMNIPERKIKNRIIIDTGNREMDLLINEFLPSQITDARLNMRSGFYQCSGAYGFRDQLQDVLALIITDPDRVKQQILRCAAVQFRQGDVLHWWHSTAGRRRGIRSRYSDDPLWLCYVTAKYVLMTGDRDILGLEIGYLDASELSESENERYDEYSYCERKEALLGHLFKALDKALEYGSHGLLLMHGGDWNDGMNGIGRSGAGESVWLSEFACIVLDKIADMLDFITMDKDAHRYRKTADKLREDIEKNAFFTDRYARAFDSRGRAVGVGSNSECEIDLIAQSFAVLCSLNDRKRLIAALECAEKLLVDDEAGLVKLLTPAFSEKSRDIGYISAYPEGVRENGGQYTHAVLWYVRALLKAGQREKALSVLNMINPLKKFSAGDEAYMTEPYYLCGDVCTSKGYRGRGNWSIYTGAASWYFTTVTQELLGLGMKNGKLYLNPGNGDIAGDYSVKVIRGNKCTEFSVKDSQVSEKTFDI